MNQQLNTFELQALFEKKDQEIGMLRQENTLLNHKVKTLTKWNIGWQRYGWNTNQAKHGR